MVISRPWSSCKNNGSATENLSKTKGRKRRRKSEKPAPRNYWRGANIQSGRSRTAYAVSNNRQTNVAVASNSAPAITSPQVFALLGSRWQVEASDVLTYPTPPFLFALYVIVLMPCTKHIPDQSIQFARPEIATAFKQVTCNSVQNPNPAIERTHYLSS